MGLLDSDLKQLASSFLERKLYTIPVEGKGNYQKDWQKSRDPINDFPEYVWKKSTGIGLLCGEPSGVICLDIDILNPESEIRKKLISMLPPILSGKAGNPAKPPSQFFRYNGERNQKFLNIDVEILSTGNQTVLPPSIHPDTHEPYKWIGTPLTDLDIDDLPYLPEGLIDFLETENAKHSSGKAYQEDNQNHAPGRCRHNSHNLLSKIGVSLVHKNYDFERLVKRLLIEDKEYNRQSDYLYFLCPTRKWRHKIAEENAKDFVDEIFKNHGPFGKKEIKQNNLSKEVKLHEKSLVQKSDEEIAAEITDLPKGPYCFRSIHELFNVPPMEIKFDLDRSKENPKPVPPSHAEVAQHFLAYFGDSVRKYEDNVFYYCGTHWIEWTDLEKTMLIEAITRIFFCETSYGRVNSIEKYIFRMMTPFKHNPYVQNQFLANFQDGTLELVSKRNKYELKFRPHSKEDLCTYVLPFKYDIDRSIRNPNFDATIHRITNGCPHKIRQIKQIYGAILLPGFPHIILLFGKSGTGKSTVIRVGIKLRDTGSMSFSDPTSWGSTFGLEPMLGKLVNVDTDIDGNKAIPDAIVKKIEDRYLFPVNRKNKAIVFAPIPPVHIFAANQLPKTYEFGSKAHDRRWTFIKFDTFDGVNNSNRDFPEQLFNECPEAVLNFALEGLLDLINSGGAYYQSDESKKTIREWQMSNDSLSQFLKECTEGCVLSKESEYRANVFLRQEPLKGLLTYSPDDQTSVIERKKLWTLFCQWHRESYQRPAKISKFKFYSTLRDSGVKEKVIQGERFFCGFICSEQN